MSRKKADFLQLLTYINKGKERENTAIFHNLRTDPDDISIIAQEFQENAQYSPTRKNGVECYHEILSLPEQNYPKNFAPQIIEELAREYLYLRAPNALAYAKVHRDTKHPHIHFCISSNQIKQKKKNRLSIAEFRQVKKQLKAYARKRFPELELSDSPTPEKQKKRCTTKPSQQQQGRTIKTELAEKILEIFSGTQHLHDAESMLIASGIEAYQRGKNTFYGVIFQGKKYRLSTLKIKNQVDRRIAVWERKEKRLAEITAITQAKERVLEVSRTR